MSRKPSLSRDVRPLSEFRANTAEFVRHVRETGQPLILTQHGRSAAVLLDVSEYDRLVDRAELAQDIRTAEAQLSRGEADSQESVEKRVRTRLKS